MNWYDRLDQGDIWIDAHLVEHPIATMDRHRCGRVLNWMHRHADNLANQAAWAMRTVPLPDIDGLAYDAVAADLNSEHHAMVTDPRAWLLTTPLVHALRVRAGWDTCPLPDHPKDCHG